MLLRYRLSVSIVLAGVLGAVSLVAFGWVRYAPPDPHAGDLKIPRSPAPDHGWSWSGGTPGWSPAQMSHDVRELNGNVWTNDLAGARLAAAKLGIAPNSIRVLRSMRVAVHDGFLAIVAGSDRSGRTCLGFVLPRQPVSFTCPRSQVAFVVVAAMPVHRDPPSWPALKAHDDYGMFLMGVARGDVAKIFAASDTPGGPFYERSSYFWGTFEDTTASGYVVGRAPSRNPWRARLDFFAKDDLLASVPIRPGRAGYSVVSVR